MTEPTVDYVEYIAGMLGVSMDLVNRVAEVIHAAWCGVEDCGEPSRQEVAATLAAIHEVLRWQKENPKCAWCHR